MESTGATDRTRPNNKPDNTNRYSGKGIILVNGHLNFRRQNCNQERNRTYFKIRRLYKPKYSMWSVKQE
jgi:hypothetical protein